MPYAKTIGPCIFALAAFWALLGCDDGADPTPDASAPVFPADWESTYVELRGCRLSIEHELESIRVLADADAAPHFRACLDAEGADGAGCGAPLAEGAVLLKAQYRDAACTDLLRWTAVRREAGAPGGGWRWQSVDADRRVRLDGAPPACISCHETCEGPGNLLCAMDP